MCRMLMLSACAAVLFACGGMNAVKKDAPAKGETPVAATKTADAAPTGTTLNASEAPFRVPNAAMPNISIYTVAKDEASGAFTALVKLKAGTKVPLHAHSNDYTGAALSDGLQRGMSEESIVAIPQGSAWVQKAGEGHINVCSEKADCLMLVMFKGKLDMLAQDKPFAGEVKSKTFKSDALAWVDMKKGGVKMVPLVGDMTKGAFDALFYFPAGLTTNVHIHGVSFTGALISGSHERGPNMENLKSISAGAVWHEPAGAEHVEKCGEGEPCIFIGTCDGPLDTSKVDVSK